MTAPTDAQPSATAHYAVHKQSMEKYEPYTALQKTDHKEVSVYEPLKEPTQELYESLRQSGNFYFPLLNVTFLQSNGTTYSKRAGLLQQFSHSSDAPLLHCIDYNCGC